MNSLRTVRRIWRRLKACVCAGREASNEVPSQLLPAFQDGHFYSPVVDVVDVAKRQDDIWKAEIDVPGIDFNQTSHRRILEQWFPLYIEKYDYPERPVSHNNPAGYYTQNSQFSWLDSRVLVVLLNSWRPSRMIEVGSGFSSLLAADVNRKYLHNDMEFTCIEPYPREFLRRSITGINRVIVERVEKLPLALFDELDTGDVLFVDSSHVSKTGSDVNYLIFEILPRLKRGVRIHFHDIFLPREYPKRWVLGERRSWNEQYLVRALLMYSSAFRIVFSCSYAYAKLPDLVAKALNVRPDHAFGGGSLWIEKVQAPIG